MFQVKRVEAPFDSGTMSMLKEIKSQAKTLKVFQKKKKVSKKELAAWKSCPLTAVFIAVF